MAPCLYGFGLTYESLVYTYQGFYDLGIYTFGGENWNESLSKICTNMPALCDVYSNMPKEFSTAAPMNTFSYMFQNGVEGKF